LPASLTEDSHARLWGARKGTLKQTFSNSAGDVNSMAFSPDSAMLALGMERTLELFNVHAGAARQTFKSYRDIIAIAFTPNGTVLAFGIQENDNDFVEIFFWNISENTIIQTIQIGEAPRPDESLKEVGRVQAMVFSPDGTLPASAMNDSMITIWDARTGLLKQVFHDRFVHTLWFVEDEDDVIIDIDPGKLQDSLPTFWLLSTKSGTSELYYCAPWICYQGMGYVRLPSEYRPTCIAFHRNVIALGQLSGSVVFVEVSLH
jgi:WD40 repeat protein